MSDTYSFTDSKGHKWTACFECDRGGNGNASDKCACGWQRIAWDKMGCYLGEPIIGEQKRQPKISRSKLRYKRYLEYGDMFDTFLDFCYWDTEQTRPLTQK